MGVYLENSAEMINSICLILVAVLSTTKKSHQKMFNACNPDSTLDDIFTMTTDFTPSQIFFLGPCPVMQVSSPVGHRPY